MELIDNNVSTNQKRGLLQAPLRPLLLQPMKIPNSAGDAKIDWW